MSIADAGFLGGFQTVHREFSDEPLRVEGEVPAWLGGSLLRTGPARFEVGGEHYKHWFDGLAMLSNVAVKSGEVRYTNRFLRSKNYEKVQATNKISYGQWGTEPRFSLVEKLVDTLDYELQFGDNAMVNIAEMGGELVALSTTPFAVRFDLDSLETQGRLDFDDHLLSMLQCPHPQYDDARRELVNFCTLVTPVAACFQIYAMPYGSTKRRVISRIWRSQMPLMHTFAMTPKYIVLLEYPFLMAPTALMLMPISETPYIRNYQWKPQEALRFTVIDRGSGDVVAEHETGACFAFHHVNAYEQGGEIVLDLVAYADVSPIMGTFFDKLTAPGGANMSPSEVRRYRVPVTGRQDILDYETLTTFSFEMPRTNQAFVAKPYRYVYGYGFEAMGDFYNGLVKVDLDASDPTRNHEFWHEADTYPGEPVFVAKPGSTKEDEGVLVSLVLDGAKQRSFFVVLDAETMQPLARAYLPHRESFFLHSAWRQADSGQLLTSL